MLGEIVMGGENILRWKGDVSLLRARIGMVFQKATPFPMSIYDNIAFGVRLFEDLPRARMDERVEWALSKAALWKEVKDKLNQNGNSLSGGQQQRLCIARGIAIRPEVLLLDEPCSALDPISTAKIEELIAELKSEYTVVIVTHNMQQAARCSDHSMRSISWLREGRSCSLMPKAMLSAIDIGNGVGFWNTMPTRARRSLRSTPGATMLKPSIIAWPVARCSG